MDRVESELGIEMLKEFEKSLDIERDGLTQTLERLERMRTKTEYEAAKLALGWLNRSNQDKDYDEDGSEDENKVSWYEYAHSSSAHAFLQVALGTFMYDKTPMKSVKPSTRHRRRALSMRLDCSLEWSAAHGVAKHAKTQIEARNTVY